jgi:hypothetical protein
VGSQPWFSARSRQQQASETPEVRAAARVSCACGLTKPRLPPYLTLTDIHSLPSHSYGARPGLRAFARGPSRAPAPGRVRPWREKALASGGAALAGMERAWRAPAAQQWERAWRSHALLLPRCRLIVATRSAFQRARAAPCLLPQVLHAFFFLLGGTTFIAGAPRSSLPHRRCSTLHAVGLAVPSETQRTVLAGAPTATAATCPRTP